MFITPKRNPRPCGYQTQVPCPLSPWEPLFYFLTQICLYSTFQVDVITRCLSFCVWLLSVIAFEVLLCCSMWQNFFTFSGSITFTEPLNGPLFIYFDCSRGLLLYMGLSLSAASRGSSWLWCVGFSLRWLLMWPRSSVVDSWALELGLSSCSTWA